MKIPYGYKIEHGRAMPNPEEYHRLRMLFNLVKGGNSVAAAAKGAGIPRSKTCCRRMLTNPVYLGTDYYPRLIDEDLMEEMHSILAKRAQRTQGKGGPKPREVIPIQTEFFLRESHETLPEDPVEYAMWMYNRIVPRE